jgi:hypothetical protein
MPYLCRDSRGGDFHMNIACAKGCYRQELFARRWTHFSETTTNVYQVPRANSFNFRSRTHPCCRFPTTDSGLGMILKQDIRASG